jgi:hypothetical protein
MSARAFTSHCREQFMRNAIAVALFALASASASAQTVTADCTTSCRLVADPEPGMTIGVDKCQLWGGATKLAENLYAGGTVTDSTGAVIPVGCVFNVTIADGVTVSMQANHWRMKDNMVSPSGSILTLRSLKPLPPVTAPLNLRLAQELRAIADLIAAGKSLD